MVRAFVDAERMRKDYKPGWFEEAEEELERRMLEIRRDLTAELIGAQSTVIGDGSVTVAVPVAGNFVLALLVVPVGQKVDDASRWSVVGMRADPVAIGEVPPTEIGWDLDAATIERLRQDLAKE